MLYCPCSRPAVVNRTHPEQRADPFTPAGVVACLLRLGWLIRRDEQDTHEMFYVLVSTLQEEPPPPPALSAAGLRAADAPIEADTGEPLVDWGALGARMRSDARDICGAGSGTARVPVRAAPIPRERPQWGTVPGADPSPSRGRDVSVQDGAGAS